MTQDAPDPELQHLPPGENEERVEEAAEELSRLPMPSVDSLPGTLIAFPLRRSVPFPSLIMPVQVEEGPETEIMEAAVQAGGKVGLLPAPGGPPEGLPTESSQYADMGVLAEIHRRIRLPDGNSNFLCRGIRRFRVERFLRVRGLPRVRVSYPEDRPSPGRETEALARNVLEMAQKVAAHNPSLGEGFSLAALNIEAAGQLADFCAAYLVRDAATKLSVLRELDVRERLMVVDEALTRELVTLELGDRIQQEIRARIEQQQKEFFLREQIKVIKRELGEEKEPQEQDRDYFLKKLEEGDYPEEVEAKVRDELERLALIPQTSPEYSVVRTYLDWLVELPWSVSSEDSLDLKRARRVLDKHHYGLEEAKERILEFLAVRKLRKEPRGAILCFAGPPGVGKTSLAMALAEAMGRRFERMSLGGMRDEAEIKGHRRTYVGAMPGRIVQMIKRAGTNNPILVLDEIDKLGKDFRGDPASALLEVLDPAQNHAFLDLYLDLPFDLSKVLFIATANVVMDIPDALRDRMEIIELPGYIEQEKVMIAKRHLLPRQIRENGLEPDRIVLPVATLRLLIRGWTREAGVRGLEKMIASLCRKRAMELAEGKRPRPEIGPKRLEKYLGPPRFLEEEVRLHPGVGVALGLAYTPYGGDVLEIEAVSYPGRGVVQATGRLGEVMQESTRIAHAYLRSHGRSFGIDVDLMQGLDLHVHFPAGAVPKDGPSAGIAAATAMVSCLTGHSMRARTAMTGEISLTGEVLPVGGLREKVLAAKRQGVRRIVLPKDNRPDVEVLEKAWTRGLEFVWVESYEEVFRAAFPARFVEAARRAAN